MHIAREGGGQVISQMSPIHTKPYIHACLPCKSIKGVQESQEIGIHHQNMIPLWTKLIT